MQIRAAVHSCLLLVLLFWGAPVAAEAAQERRHFNDCRDGRTVQCDLSRLTDEQRREVEQAAQRRNVHACRTGHLDACDPDALDPRQRQADAGDQDQPSDAERRSHLENLHACRTGQHGRCDLSLLSAEERQLVEAAMARRNRDACLAGGHARCDETLLSAWDYHRLDEQRQRANLSACLWGLEPCERSRLTVEEERQVAAAARQRQQAERLALARARAPRVTYVAPRGWRGRDCRWYGACHVRSPHLTAGGYWGWRSSRASRSTGVFLVYPWWL